MYIILKVFFFAVTPPVIKDVRYMKRTIGCNLVEWTPIDTGNCHVTYNIQYENETGIVGITSNINDATHAWCTNVYFESTDIKIWEVFGDNVGAKSSAIPLTENPCNAKISPGEHIFVI